MAVLATDTFDRQDDSTLGPNWTELIATRHFDILTNAAKPDLYSNDTLASYTAISWPDDQYVQATVTGISGGSTTSGIGVAFRIGSVTAYYRVVVAGAGANNVTIQKFNPGSSTLQSITQTFSDGDILKVQMSGSTIKVYRNGVQIGTDQVDGDLASGSVGIAYSSTITAGSLLDFEGGSLSVSQKLRPDADTTTTGWTTTPLWSKIEEEVADGTIVTATAS